MEALHVSVLSSLTMNVSSLKVLIKKSYDRTRRAKRRNWKLQEMAKDREGMDTDDER